MQKKLITLAVAAALTAPVAAMADVTVYGLMHYSYDWVSAAGDSEDNTGVSRESRIGFKGAEDLGGGLKGVWQIEAAIDNANDKFKFRNTFVGLSGDWGTVLAGRHDTPYKLATTKLDFFVDRAADYNNLIGTVNGTTVFDERGPQVLAYVSPNWSGFSFALAYDAHYFNDEAEYACDTDGDGVSDETCDADDKSDRLYSGMLMYDNAGFFASAAYEYHEGPNLEGVTGEITQWTRAANAAAPVACDALAGTPPCAVSTLALSNFSDADFDSTAWKIGLGYTFGGTTIGAIYENISLSADDVVISEDFFVPGADGTAKAKVGDLERDAWYITAQHAFGNSVIKGYYGQAGELDDVKVRATSSTLGTSVSGKVDLGDSGADFWAIGYDYNFSKRTTLYALYTQVSNDDAATYTANKGQAISDDYSDPGDDVGVFSLGVIHKF
jgi:predicted porin